MVGYCSNVVCSRYICDMVCDMVLNFWLQGLFMFEQLEL